MAGKFTRVAHLWREITQIELRLKRWHKKYEILNQIESHNLGLNYVLIKSNRTALETYKVEERTFGTPCTFNLIFSKYHSILSIHAVKIMLIFSINRPSMQLLVKEREGPNNSNELNKLTLRANARKNRAKSANRGHS